MTARYPTAHGVCAGDSIADALHSEPSMGRLRDGLIEWAARHLTKPRRTYLRILPTNAEQLRATARKGDVILVDGDQRVSQVIKYMTQSSWSHAALYVGDELWKRFPNRRAELELQYGADARHLMVEALMESGVIASPVTKYVHLNLRICRPVGLSDEHRQRVLDELIAQLGERYDLDNFLELARYFFPVSLIPSRFRHQALEMGNELTKEVICSSMIARAMQNVGYPILPQVTPVDGPSPDGWLHRLGLRRAPYPVLFHRNRPQLITPRDFDLSPYFAIVKLGAIETRFDYRRIRWA